MSKPRQKWYGFFRIVDGVVYGYATALPPRSHNEYVWSKNRVHVYPREKASTNKEAAYHWSLMMSSLKYLQEGYPGTFLVRVSADSKPIPVQVDLNQYDPKKRIVDIPFKTC